MEKLSGELIMCVIISKISDERQKTAASPIYIPRFSSVGLKNENSGIILISELSQT